MPLLVKQRGWTQEQLAERWGYSRGYVSQIEAGSRKLDSTTQLVRLADILDIPQEKLEAIGRGIPARKIKTTSSQEADSTILQMLLAPGRDMVQLAYMLWIADQHQILEDKLRELTIQLDQMSGFLKTRGSPEGAAPLAAQPCSRGWNMTFEKPWIKCATLLTLDNIAL